MNPVPVKSVIFSANGTVLLSIVTGRILFVSDVLLRTEEPVVKCLYKLPSINVGFTSTINSLETRSVTHLLLNVVKESLFLHSSSLVTWLDDMFQAVELPAVSCLSEHQAD